MKAEGIITPILTPMNSDESINYEQLGPIVERQIASGVNGIFCFGTNGESYILSDEEKLSILKEVVSCVSKRVPVYAGTGQPGTKHTISLSQKAQKIGVDALSIISPFFAAPNQNEIINHYKAVASSVDIPIILYNIPARTGTNMSPSTIAALAGVENIIGAKDSSGNFDNMLQYIELTRDIKKRNGDGFSILSGNDSLILWCLIAGGKGGISGVANVYPDNMTSIYRYFTEGNIKAAREAQDAIRSFRNTFKYGNPNTIIKMSAEILGYNVGPCRAPFNSLSSEGICFLTKILEENKAKGLH